MVLAEYIFPLSSASGHLQFLFKQKDDQIIFCAILFTSSNKDVSFFAATFG